MRFVSKDIFFYLSYGGREMNWGDMWKKPTREAVVRVKKMTVTGLCERPMDSKMKCLLEGYDWIGDGSEESSNIL